MPPPRPENTLSPFTRDLTPPPERPKKPQQQQLPRPPLQPVAVLQQQQQQIQQSLVAMPATAVTPPTAAAMTTVHSQITLSEPRPGQERTQNVYVDAPLPKQQNRAAAASGRSGVATAPEAAASALPQSEAKVRRSAAAREGPASVGRRARTKASEAPPPKKQLQQSGVSPDSSLSAASMAVPEPPISVTKVSEIMSPPPLVPPDDEDSIICRRCGRCRCYACRAPRRLPERWLCNNAVHVSASSLVSCLSCMCAADAVLYHCGKDTLEDSATGNVKGGKWRWVCAAALSLVFPCLCCFLPLKGCQKVTEAAYAKATSNGCRCEEEGDGGRRKNVITSVPASPLTTFSSSVTAASVISSPSTSGGGGGATGEKNNDLFEQRLLL